MASSSLPQAVAAHPEASSSRAKLASFNAQLIHRHPSRPVSEYWKASYEPRLSATPQPDFDGDLEDIEQSGARAKYTRVEAWVADQMATNTGAQIFPLTPINISTPSNSQFELASHPTTATKPKLGDYHAWADTWVGAEYHGGNRRARIHREIGRVVLKRLLQMLKYLLVFLTMVFFAFLLERNLMSTIHRGVRNIDYTGKYGQTYQNYSPAFAPPEFDSYRFPDTVDTFAQYNYRNHSDTSCRISSLDLHLPFAPLCPGRQNLLDAISGGGRIGFDAPFMPRGCDMRWFNTQEICEIFGRFEKVIVVGDSMMRHVVGALNVLLREDLGYGAVTGWNFGEEELKQCFCNSQFDVKACSVQGIFTTDSVRQNAPESLACRQPIDLTIEMMLKFPLDPTEVKRFQSLLSTTRPKKPYAFIFGHGLWNDLDLQATVNWLDGILAATREQAPYLDQSPSSWHRLFVSPNAAGILKPDQWITSQGDKALQIFEAGSRQQAALRGVEHLGTWNLSIQASKYDGVHLDLKGNLVKAMAVVNWLGML